MYPVSIVTGGGESLAFNERVSVLLKFSLTSLSLAFTCTTNLILLFPCQGKL